MWIYLMKGSGERNLRNSKSFRHSPASYLPRTCCRMSVTWFWEWTPCNCTWKYPTVERQAIKRTTTFARLISTSDQATANGLHRPTRTGVESNSCARKTISITCTAAGGRDSKTSMLPIFPFIGSYSDRAISSGLMLGKIRQFLPPKILSQWCFLILTFVLLNLTLKED